MALSWIFDVLASALVLTACHAVVFADSLATSSVINIEFKNNYDAKMTLSVEIQDGYGGGRMDINSGETYKSYYFTDNKNASGIYFSVNKVKFNDTSWGGPYYKCDH